MNLILFIIMIILLIFLIFYIKATNENFYDKYLFFINNKLNILNIGISIILSIILIKMNTSRNFLLRIADFYVYEEKEIFIRFFLFFLYTLFVFRFYNLKFIKDIYSNKITFFFFLIYFLLIPIFFKEYIVQDKIFYFILLTALFYFLTALVLCFKKKNKNYIIIPVSILVITFINIYITEKKQDLYYYDIKQSTKNSGYFEFDDYDFPISFHPTKFFKIKFNGDIKNNFFDLHYTDGVLSSIKFNNRKNIYLYGNLYNDYTLNIISFFIAQSIYDIEEAEDKLLSFVLNENNSIDEILKFPYKILYKEDGISYITNFENCKYISDNMKIGYSFKKENYIKKEEWNNMNGQTARYIIENSLKIIKTNADPKKYNVFLSELGIKK